MFTRQNVILYVLTVIIITFGRECRCQICDIDFHMESSSVMLLEGENASVLCDATCYGSDNIQVVWRDSSGNQIGSFPGGIFSVRYNRGLMNRLMIIGASIAISGDYVCSVSRSGELLEQKFMNVVVLGSQTGSNYIPPEETGPRRGDMAPRRDIKYRPVRSINWALSNLGKASFSDESLINNAAESEMVNRELKSRENKEGITGVEVDSNLLKMMLVNGDRRQINDIKATNRDNGLMINTNLGQVVEKSGRNNFGTRKNFMSMIGLGKFNRDVLRNINILQTLPINRNNTNNLDSRKQIIRDDHQFGRSRVKRQDSSTRSTDEPETSSSKPTTEELSTKIDNSTVEEITTAMFSPDNTSHDSTDVVDEDDFSETPTPGSESKETTVDQKTLTQTSQCPQMPQEQSNFGKYGVLAFAISLAVVFLLLYSILMIIFMPRMLARRRNKENIEGATYKKKGPDLSETAPLTILDSTEKADDDPIQGQQETSDIGKSASEVDKGETAKKDEETKEISANVSTFLIRHESQKKAQDEAKSGSTEEKSSEPDKGTPTADSNQANSIKTTSPEKDVAAEVKTTNLADNLLSSLLPELDLLNSTSSTNQIQSENNTSPDSKVDNIKTPNDPGTNNPNALQSDLPPPPPPPEGSDDIIVV